MTFLEMCQAVFRESGISSSATLSGVVAQSGMNQNIVTAVNNASLSIQGKFTDWKFLWKEWTQALDIGANTGAYNEYAPPADIGQFVYRDDAIRLDGNPISILDYEQARLVAQSTATGTPSFAVIMPNGRVRMSPIPVAAGTLVAEYYSAPVAMTQNADTSPIPAAYHRAIITLALSNIAAGLEDWENFKKFSGEHQIEMTKLEAAQLAGHAARTQASGEDNVVRAE